MSVTEQEPPRAHHDMGGLSRLMCESVDASPHALTEFDKDVDALCGLLRARGLMAVDELRRGIEAIPPDQYDRLTYYQRWMRSITDNLLSRGILTEAELGTALAEAAAC